MASNNNEQQTSTKAKGVYVIEEGKNGESYWAKIGVAFTNRDQSLSVRLTAVPVDGKLHIRDFKERQAE